MTKERKPISETIKHEVISRCNNRCCVCQTPFIVIHHIDEDPSNNQIDNLAPLCPNCHSQAHSSSQMTTNLTSSRITTLRDKWYEYCVRRRDSLAIDPNAILKVINLVRTLGPAQYGWKKTFSAIDPSYKYLSREEIIIRIFSTSNRNELVTYLRTIMGMYDSLRNKSIKNEDALREFSSVCNAFGIDYSEIAHGIY